MPPLTQSSLSPMVSVPMTSSNGGTVLIDRKGTYTTSISPSSTLHHLNSNLSPMSSSSYYEHKYS